MYCKNLFKLDEFASIKDAIKILKENDTTIMVCRHNDFLVGVLTRRDIRFLKEDDVQSKRVIDFATTQNLVTMSSSESIDSMIAILNQYKINSIPIIDNKNRILDLFSYKDVLTQDKQCFTILPFSNPYLEIYENNIKALLEDKFPLKVLKVDDIFKAEPIIDTIQFMISKADFLICDISEKNPNVYYEIGYAHALKKTIIFITQDIDNVPFDIIHWKCIPYKYTNLGLKALEDKLLKMVEEIIKEKPIYLS